MKFALPVVTELHLSSDGAAATAKVVVTSHEPIRQGQRIEIAVSVPLTVAFGESLYSVRRRAAFEAAKLLAVELDELEEHPGADHRLSA